MSKSVIQSGICGFTTEVVARGDSDTCSLIITSDCPAIQKLAEELRQVDPMEEITHKGKGPLTLLSAPFVPCACRDHQSGRGRGRASFTKGCDYYCNKHK